MAALIAWALTVLDAAVPAYAIGGLGGLRDAGGRDKHEQPRGSLVVLVSRKRRHPSRPRDVSAADAVVVSGWAAGR